MPPALYRVFPLISALYQHVQDSLEVKLHAGLDVQRPPLRRTTRNPRKERLHSRHGDLARAQRPGGSQPLPDTLIVRTEPVPRGTRGGKVEAVSYTHLTLPTIYSV